MSLLVIAVLQISLLFRNVISTCSTTSDVEFTFYGFPDGPSDTTSFGCSGTTQVADGTAGGDGTYANPETFATALNNPSFTPCEIIYIPLFQKYFQYMDHCQECMTLYPSTTRIDLWIGSDVNGGQTQIDCEDALGLKTGQTIVRDPPATLKVSGVQIWDNDEGKCNDDTALFPNYGTSQEELCGAGGAPLPSPSSSAGGPAPSSALPASTPSSTPSSPQPPPISPSTTQSPSTLATIVSSATPTLTSASTSASSTSPSPSGASTNCGVTPEWPTAWLGHCVGAPCHEFNDCSGELICQGWPKSVCTDPREG
ncbi:hypothetical protein BDR22DRAFT_819550 [Usnea florida]